MDLTKSQSEIEIRNKNMEMSASSPNVDMSRSGIIQTDNIEVDHMKRYTINGPIP